VNFRLAVIQETEAMHLQIRQKQIILVSLVCFSALAFPVTSQAVTAQNFLQNPTANSQSQNTLPLAPTVPAQAAKPSPISAQLPITSNSMSTGMALIFFGIFSLFGLLIVLMILFVIFTLFRRLFSGKSLSRSPSRRSFNGSNRNYRRVSSNYSISSGDDSSDYGCMSSSDYSISSGDDSSDYSCTSSSDDSSSSGDDSGGGDYGCTSSSDYSISSGDYSSSGDYGCTSSSDYSSSSSDYSSSSSDCSSSFGGGGGDY
jgi:hypothetical protein